VIEQMNTNPYESPQSHAVVQPMPNKERGAANRSVRIALSIMLIPALYNFISFNFALADTLHEAPSFVVYRTFNFIGLLLIVVAIWLLGLKFLEFLTGGIHSVVARKSNLKDWNGALYSIVRRLPFFAIPGAALWAVWVWAFYQLQLGFYSISVPIGIGAHLLAACLYVPLIYRWYKMERTAAGGVNT
jgi:hypothetical protein